MPAENRTFAPADAPDTVTAAEGEMLKRALARLEAVSLSLMASGELPISAEVPETGWLAPALQPSEPHGEDTADAPDHADMTDEALRDQALTTAPIADQEDAWGAETIEPSGESDEAPVPAWAPAASHLPDMPIARFAHPSEAAPDTLAAAADAPAETGPEPRRWARRSPELQKSAEELAELNTRIAKFIKFCNAAIIETRNLGNQNASAVRDSSQQGSLSCAS